MQNCTTVECFVLHAAHSWKAYHVSFPTQQTSYHLDFPIRSYGRFSGDCTEDQQPCEVPRVFSSWWLLSYHNPGNSKSHSHPTRRVVSCISTPCILEMKEDFDNEIEPLLFSCVLTNSESDLYPFALVISLGIIEAAASSAPNPCSCYFMCKLRRLVLWECDWANPWFRLPYRDGGWLLVRVIRLH